MLGEFYMASFYRNENLKKCLLIVLWGVTLFEIGFGIQFYRGLGQKFDAVQNIPINEVKLDTVADGTYEGEYTFETISAKVTVIVKDNEIKKITLDEFETDKGEAAADIVDTIVSDQSVMVDDVTKATDSSRVIKLAVLNALGQ